MQHSWGLLGGEMVFISHLVESADAGNLPPKLPAIFSASSSTADYCFPSSFYSWNIIVGISVVIDSLTLSELETVTFTNVFTFIVIVN